MFQAFHADADIVVFRHYQKDTAVTALMLYVPKAQGLFKNNNYNYNTKYCVTVHICKRL